MMKYLKIDKGKLAGFLDELRKTFRVVAPIKKEGLVLFEEIGSGGEALLDFANSRQSPKGFFFPQAVVNFLAFLSWNPGDDREKMEMDELIGAFSIENINKKRGSINKNLKTKISNLKWRN